MSPADGADRKNRGKTASEGEKDAEAARQKPRIYAGFRENVSIE